MANYSCANNHLPTKPNDLVYDIATRALYVVDDVKTNRLYLPNRLESKISITPAK